MAERFWERFRGWIGKRSLERGEGLLFPRCNSVHMWFMRVPIDVVFLRAKAAENGRERWVVTSTREGVRPWRFLPLWDPRAQDTLELPAGTLARHEVSAGDEICLS